MTKFKFDAYSTFSNGEIKIAKAIWISGFAEPIKNCDGRYKVPADVEALAGKIRYWDHEPDQIISTTPGREGELITLGGPYIFVYKER